MPPNTVSTLSCSMNKKAKPQPWLSTSPIRPSDTDAPMLEMFNSRSRKWFSFKLRFAGATRLDWPGSDGGAYFNVDDEKKVLSMNVYRSHFPMRRC